MVKIKTSMHGYDDAIDLIFLSFGDLSPSASGSVQRLKIVLMTDRLIKVQTPILIFRVLRTQNKFLTLTSLPHELVSGCGSATSPLFESSHGIAHSSDPVGW